jgi:hypothetical protein
LAIGPGRLIVRVQRGVPAQLQLRRFASAYRYLSFGNAPPPFARSRLSDGKAMTMQIPRDSSELPWHARVAGGREVLVCHT